MIFFSNFPLYVPLNLLRIKKNIKRQLQYAILVRFRFFFSYSNTALRITKNASYVTYNLRYCCSIIHTKISKRLWKKDNGILKAKENWSLRIWYFVQRGTNTKCLNSKYRREWTVGLPSSVPGSFFVRQNFSIA